jgi:hypothetical protein
MLYLYLDESGDLGFDFVNKKPSLFFTVCVLAIKGTGNDQTLAALVRAVVRRKLLRGSGLTRPELKGSGTTIEVKRFFYEKVRRLDFKLFLGRRFARTGCISPKNKEERANQGQCQGCGPHYGG